MYFQPDEFRVDVQASIQAFRSVTFVLQNQKSKLPNFEIWYSNWQSKLRGDSTLRWLVDARNRIEKQGDLETKSTLRVTKSGSWLDIAPLDIELPPRTLPDQIVSLVLPVLGTKNFGDEAILKVERRWVESTLPEAEVLDALCHCYIVLRKLVTDAHSVLAPQNSEACEFFRSATNTNEVLPEFMMNAQQPRVTWIRLKDSSPVTINTSVHVYSRADSDLQNVAKRYGLKTENLKALKDAKTFRDECLFWFQHGKTLLQVDGYHIPTAMLKTGHTLQLLQLRMDDRAEKHMMFRHLADTAKRLGAHALIFINEAWVAPAAFAASGKHAVDFPARKEALVLHGLSRSGEALSLINVFSRKDKQIVFGTDIEHEGDIPNMLNPFVKAWNIQRKTV